MMALATSMMLLIILNLPANAIEIQEVVSPKGIKAWLVEDNSVPLVSMRFSFKGGTSQDPGGKEGLANLMTGLFDEGAGDLDSDSFQERIDNLGGEMSFTASPDSVSGSIRMLAENRDAVSDLLALAVNKPRFDQDAVDRIRQQVVASLEASQRNPSTIASRKFSEVLYGNHPYGRPDEGTVKSLQSISREDLATFHRKNFARDRLTVGVVGSINAKDLGEMLDKVFGDLPANAELVPVPDAKLALGTTTSLSFDMPQTSISFVYPAIPRKDPEFFAAYLMNHILGGGFTSRLYAEVREKRGLAYSVSSSMALRDHVSALTISTATRPEKAQESLKIIREQVAAMANDGPTEAELQAAKSYLKGSYAVNNLDSSVSIADTLVGLQEAGLDREYIDKRAELIDAVTLDQVKAIAKKLLEAEPAILIFGPAQS
ncbi:MULTISPECIES: M16 family metallopeptidase [Brucella]|nr:MULTISPECIES: pitrilysin family protein [Brucella]MQP42145.1 insulinase family protein [Ochrobactrum sp. MYb237]NNV20243.1 insulinase family protein [Brucella pseudogrignonensis]PQZ41479.1 insulinase family protein [Brucella pseudogrignonensis]PRA39581.1 insulinase family protein [Brucella pseudogrignonensis]PRA65100.1 insulinase family protein [Brucella pseudogrignonensis]